MKKTLAGFLIVLLVLLSSCPGLADARIVESSIVDTYIAPGIEKLPDTVLSPSRFVAYSKEGGQILALYPMWYVKNKLKKKNSVAVMAGTTTEYAYGFKYYDTDGYKMSLVVSSSDEKIATAYFQDKKCYLEAVAPGTCVITCYDTISGLRCSLSVKVAPKRITGVAFDAPQYNVVLGDTLSLEDKLVITPSDAVGNGFNYKSSKKKNVTVSTSGIVTGLRLGSAIINVVSKSNKAIKASCIVNVIEHVPDEKDVVYRFFGIGNDTYAGRNRLYSCVNDAKGVAYAYKYSTLDGKTFPIKDIHLYTNCTSTDMLKVLNNMITSGADDNDVSIFYYSGHGASGSGITENAGALLGTNGKYVTVSEIQQYLDKVPGTVLVMLDSCYSGQFIESKDGTGTANQSANAFNEAWIRAFSQSSKALTDSEYKNKYKIITACQPDETSMSLGYYSAFTGFVVNGLGTTIDGKKLQLMADTNLDNTVTLKELYDYTEHQTRNYVDSFLGSRIDQHTMVWPENDPFVVLTRDPS